MCIASISRCLLQKCLKLYTHGVVMNVTNQGPILEWPVMLTGEEQRLESGSVLSPLFYLHHVQDCSCGAAEEVTDHFQQHCHLNQ